MRKYFINVLLAILNRYEGGQRWTGPGRSWIPAEIQDARFDADAASREEIMRKARYWERNNAVVNRLADVFEQYTVGGGLPIQPDSSDSDWNENAKTYWENSCKLLNLCNRQPFSSDQSLCARTWFIDGEIFILKTRGESGFPRIQLIESHRVRTPPIDRTLENKTIIDGVEVDNSGRPIAYWVNTGLDMETFRRIDANQVIHIFEPSRVGQYRGLSFLYAILNDIHDLDDLQILEQKAARQAAKVGNIITTASGELSADQLRNERYRLEKQDSAGVEVTEDRIKYISSTIGGQTAALKTGQTLEQFKSERPSVAVQWYWESLISKICAGVGITKQLVYPWSLQGTVTRADLDVAAQFFKIRSGVLASAFTEIYVFVMDTGTKRDRTIADPPEDWRTVSIRPPRAPNVDVGRNSNAMLAELAAGATTLEKIYGELGMDYVAQIKQRSREIKLIKEIAAADGNEPGEISELLAKEIEPEPLDNQQQMEVGK